MRSAIFGTICLVFIQQYSVNAMDNCCDYKWLEATAKRYALSIINKGRIDPDGIERDLQFCTLDIIKDERFNKYLQQEAFENIRAQVVNKEQKEALEAFASKFDKLKDNDLMRLQFCMLLERIIIKLRSSISIDIKTHPVLKALSSNPSFTLNKMLLPSIMGEPVN